MKKAIRFGLVIALAAAMPHSLGAQGKITSDPNAPGNQVSAPKENTDSRMAQKITYDSGCKRLHAVTGDLSRMTGVDILSGQSKKDWKVRDIPVVVCVQDLPLGKLFKAIADATHTRFTSERIGDSPETSYRIYRRSADQNRLDTYVRQKHGDSLASAAWQWDALAAYGKSSEPPPTDPSLRHAWVMARLIAGLGSDSKSKLLNGDTFTLRATEPANRAYLQENYRISCDKCINQSPSFPSWEEVEDAPLQIKLEDTGTEARIMAQFGPYLIGSSGDQNTASGCIYGDLPDAEPLQGKVTGLPPRPETTPMPSMKDDIGNPEMVPLSDSKSDDTTGGSFLMTKITLEKSLSVKDLTFAKAIRAIAQTGQCNIVTEDFTSQKAQKDQRINGALIAPTENTIRGLLDMFDRSAWFVSEDDRLIVGWQNCGRYTWRDHHANMLPEDYLNGLKAKLGGDGLELEDAIHLSNLPEPSAIEWVVYTDDFPNLYQWKLDPAWRLYDALVEQDKQLAKSGDGLPLGKFDSAWIADFFHAGKMGQGPSYEPIAPPGSDKQDAEAYKQKAREEAKLDKVALSDPAAISTMIMRIQKKPAKNRYATVGGMGTSVDIAKGLDLSSYEMAITCNPDGESRTIHIPSPYLAFPIWSPEREAEIIKAQATDGK